MSDHAPRKDQLAARSRSEVAPYDPRLVSLHQPDSWEAEQFRALRYSLLRVLEPRKGNVIGISSPAAGNGKTTTAINLAGALAEADARVLLIDADLRGASVARRLGFGPVIARGLDSAISDRSLSLEDVVRHVPGLCGFGILPTASQPDIAHRLLASPRFGTLLQQARDLYDFIVVDTPPLVPVADCRTMAQWIDGFVVVVAAHRTPRKLLGEALNAMGEDQILGLVFNGDDGPLWGHRGHVRAAY